MTRMKLTGKVALVTNVRHYMGPAVTEEFGNISAGRPARGEESARLAVYLAGEDSDFFGNPVMPFAGGWIGFNFVRSRP